jgi:DNA-binding NarL/FixJ family response regulator
MIRPPGQAASTGVQEATKRVAAHDAPSGRIRIVIVDDHPVMRDGTAALLAREADFDVVGVAGSVEAAAPLLDRGVADVVLLDIRLGSASGLTLLDAASGPALGPLPARSERPAIVVMTAYDYPQYVDAALRLGASGFVLKTAPIAELIEAIRRAAAGGLAFGVRPTGAAHLSPRELEVTRLVVDGRSNDEIGVALGIGAKTVETHLSRLFARFGLASRTELATRALREGWMDVPLGRS